MAIAGKATIAAPGDSGAADKAKRRWVGALFGLPFAAAGIAVLVFLALPTIADTWRARSWEQGEARIESARLETHRDDDGTTYRAIANYSYDYRGQAYRGDRVAIAGGSDNLGSFQQDLARRLIAARDAGEPVPVWINPENPREAVLNRDVRWGLMVTSLGMGVVFTGVGSSLVWLGLRRRRNAAQSAGVVERPWLLRPEWAGPEIASGGGPKTAWAVAAIWNVIAVPVGIGCASEFLDGNKPAGLGLLLPLAGAWLLGWAIRQTLAWRRHGRAPLVMDPYPGAIGGQVGGTVDLQLAYDPGLVFRTSLTCIYSYLSGSGKNRNRKERVVWQTEGAAWSVPRLAHTRLEILFDVDSGLPASDPQDESAYHLWRLRVAANLPGIDFERVFEIPVFPTGASARELRRLSTEHRAAADERSKAIEHVLDIHRVPGGVELYFPAFRHPRVKVLGTLFGSAFLAAGVLVGAAPLPMRAIFGLVGGSIVVVSLWNLLVSLRVRIDRDGLRVERRLLGVPVGGATLARDEISCLSLDQAYSLSSGGKHTVYFKLQARTTGGRTVKIGHNLPGRETAKQVLNDLSELVGIPVDPRLEGNVLA